ncbi:M50 family metallopeptidase [Cryptosporangium minutisporangium]
MTAGLLPLSVLLAPSPAPSEPGPAATPGRLEEVMSNIAEAQPSAPTWLVICTGLAALGLSGSFVFIDWLVSASHEGAHAVMSDFTSKLEWVKIPLNGNPGTKPSDDTGHLASIAIGVVGYIGPSLFGLLGAVLLAHDHPVAVLWLAIVLFAALLWNITNPFGFVVVGLLGGFVLVVAWSTSIRSQTTVAYLMVWSLLIAGLGDVAKLAVKSDHTRLRELTWIPARIWALSHLAFCAYALYLGGRMLLTG